MKASAVAHPIQGLIKYHGLADERLRLPYHDSISVCTAPLLTHTTVEFGDFPRDTAAIDGSPPAGPAMARILEVVNSVRMAAKTGDRFRMESRNNFPSNVGLGASASGFAALAMATMAAAGTEPELEAASRFARRGAGSATRAVTGGFSRWRMGASDADSFAVQLAGEDLQMGIVVALVPAYKETDAAHAEAPRSPFFQARLAEMPRMLTEMELAIRQRDVGKIAMLAERDTMLLHGITMTGPAEMLLWRPETLSVMLRVRAMRDHGLPAFFSIDTGATVYVNTFPDRVSEVRQELSGLGVPTTECRVGGPARCVDDHLF